jgi:hypothetical protein
MEPSGDSARRLKARRGVANVISQTAVVDNGAMCPRAETMEIAIRATM